MRRVTSVGRTTGTAIALAVACVLAAAAPAGAAVFSNTGQITVPTSTTNGAGNPSPSTIEVTGLTGAVTNVTATLTGVRHTFPSDLDVLLVGPSGQSVVLLADTGGGTDINNVNLTFSDAAATPVPSPITSGTFRPTGTAFSQTPPPVPPPFGATLAIFNGTVPNGTWRLFTFDDFPPADNGAIAGGWSLDITTNGPTIASFEPATGPAGTNVVITGTNLTGATNVTFGGIPAAAFTVNNPTTISATVPANAVSGPITVTTPNGTATSAQPFQISPPPVIGSLAPTSGAVGTQVTITGANLTGATEVRFGGTPAATFNVASPTSITATVPNGAGAGQVTVTTPGGTGTSSAPFVVTHARAVTLGVNRRRARGRVTADDGFARCTTGVTVAVQRRARGRWRAVGQDVTNAAGRFRVAGSLVEGRYRAVARPTTLATGDRCLRGVSERVGL